VSQPPDARYPQVVSIEKQPLAQSERNDGSRVERVEEFIHTGHVSQRMNKAKGLYTAVYMIQPAYNV
jgi:hypothetical protein